MSTDDKPAVNPKLLRKALSDPGAFTPRDESACESLVEWQVRAILETAILCDATEPAADMERLTRRIVDILRVNGAPETARADAETLVGRWLEQGILRDADEVRREVIHEVRAERLEMAREEGRAEVRAAVEAVAVQVESEHDDSLVTADYLMIARRFRAALSDTGAALAKVKADAAEAERDRITDQLDDWGDEVEDFYPLGDWQSRQHVKKALHRASKRIYYRTGERG